MEIKGLWRNGSASDSRSEGWEFESLWPHIAGAVPASATWVCMPCRHSHAANDASGPCGSCRAACGVAGAAVATRNTRSAHWKSRGYGATAARLTPDQKVGSSNLSGHRFRTGKLNMRLLLGHCQTPGQCHDTPAARCWLLLFFFPDISGMSAVLCLTVMICGLGLLPNSTTASPVS